MSGTTYFLLLLTYFSCCFLIFLVTCEYHFTITCRCNISAKDIQPAIKPYSKFRNFAICNLLSDVYLFVRLIIKFFIFLDGLTSKRSLKLW